MNVIDTIWPWLPLLGRGFLLNLGMGVLAMAMASVLGTMLGAAQLASSVALSRSAQVLTQMLRNAPWLVVMFFIMQLLPYELAIGGGWPLPAWMKAVIALTLPATGNFAEIVRGGLRAVPLAQWEAATALGYSPRARLWRVILPQAVPLMLPTAMGLYCVVTMSTALGSLVGVSEGLSVAREVLAAEARTELLLPMYGLVLASFFLYIFPISMLARTLERRQAIR